MGTDFKYDAFRGKIASSGNTLPVGLKFPTIKEPSKLIWAQKPHPPAPGFFDDYPRNLVKKYQTVFQTADGIPVHLKKGMKDRVIYGVVMGITFIGTVWSCYSLFKMSQKK